MSDNNTTHRQVYQREELHKKLWEMANSLRNNMEGSEFKNYVLGLLFYRFLSEHEELQIKEYSVLCFSYLSPLISNLVPSAV